MLGVLGPAAGALGASGAASGGGAAASTFGSTWGAPLIGAGSALLGGWMGSASSSDDVQNQIKFQRRSMKRGIQWKVEDAKKAGIHPLYALGSPGFSPSPVIGGQSNMGNAVKDAGAYLAQGLEKAQINAVNASARRDEAQAALANSQAALAAQQFASNQGATPLMSVPAAAGVRPGRISAKAPEQYSRNPKDSSSTAAKNPAWGEIEYGNGKTMFVPLEDGQPQMPEGVMPVIMTLMKNMGLFDPKPQRRRGRRGPRNRK